MTDLVVAPCGMDAARYAVMRWHYSKRMPIARLARFGVWEAGRFVGAIVYCHGGNRHAYQAFGLTMHQGAELVRVALGDHDAPVSQVVAEATRQLHRASPGTRLVISYADPLQGHHGGIYQALSWAYLGPSPGARGAWRLPSGELVHHRSYTGAPGFKGKARKAPPPQALGIKARRVELPRLHRYAYGMDKAMRRHLARLAQPYPPPCGQGLASETPSPRLGGPGATPGDRSIPA